MVLLFSTKTPAPAKLPVLLPWNNVVLSTFYALPLIFNTFLSTVWLPSLYPIYTESSGTPLSQKQSPLSLNIHWPLLEPFLSLPLLCLAEGLPQLEQDASNEGKQGYQDDKKIPRHGREKMGCSNDWVGPGTSWVKMAHQWSAAYISISYLKLNWIET